MAIGRSRKNEGVVVDVGKVLVARIRVSIQRGADRRRVKPTSGSGFYNWRLKFSLIGRCVHDIVLSFWMKAVC